MYIDPIMFNWILIAAASVCAGMIGYYIGRGRSEATIADTITYLAQEGFVKSFENEDGELELVKLDDDLPK